MADSDLISNDNYRDGLMEENKKGNLMNIQDAYENLGNFNDANMETFVSQYGSDVEKFVSPQEAQNLISAGDDFSVEKQQQWNTATSLIDDYENVPEKLPTPDIPSDLNPAAAAAMILSGDVSAPSQSEEETFSPTREAIMQKSASSHPEHPKIETPKDEENGGQGARIESAGPRASPSPVSAQPCESGKSTAMEQVTSSADKTACGCPFSPVEKLVYWRDPKKSGIVFGSVLVLLLSLTYFSLISIIAYVSLAALSASISFRIYKNVLQAVQKSGEGHPYKEYLELDINAPQDRVHKIVDILIGHYNSTANKLRSIFLVEDLVDSLKFGVMLWGMTYIGAWFNGLTLIILAFVMAFSLPKFYETNKAQIDQYLNLVCAQVNDVMTKVRAKIPLLKKEKEQ